MSCCSRSIDEARHERLKALADSINETARMARATSALLLTAALYLGFTLLSSTDENLLLNVQIQVAVQQVGFGVTLEQSYIFGPPIFLYLHVQGLFLLSILARKVQEFNKALDRELSGIPNSHRVRQEYWSWLSAFAFVQLFRDDDGFHFIPRSLMWISMEAIPLLLLFAVDLSFVRYQSEWITNSHHVVFILDLVFVMWFNSPGFERRLQSHRNNLGKWFSSGYRWRRLKKETKSWLVATRISLREACPSIKTMIWTFWTWRRLAFVGIMTLLLWSEVRPPSFDVISVEETVQEIISDKGIIDQINDDISPKKMTMYGIFELVTRQRRNRIWRMDDEIELLDYQKSIIDGDKQQSNSLLDSLYKMWTAVQEKDVSVLDIGPCQWWGLACRYLSAKDLESIQWSSLNELSLAGRSLRFADLRFAELQGVNLEGAKLQGANLEGANLRHADLSRAKMDGTFLSGAELQDAALSEAELRSANLQRAQLQRAVLNGAKLWNANLRKAKLQRATFLEAELQGTNVESAYMDGASLWDATLKCTNLQGAWLRGTSFAFANLLGVDLGRAQLQGAKFQSAKLLGTNLEKSQLEGVDFFEAEIRNSFGMPESWKLAWLHKAEIRKDDHPTYFFAESSTNLSKIESDIPLFWNQEENNLQGCVKNIMKRVTNRDWLSKDALPEGEFVIFDGRDVGAPGYKKAWAKWTVDFACKNEYTGYSSVRRWNSVDPLSGLKVLICPTNHAQAEQCNILDEMKQFILGELYNAAKGGQCPGLRTVPDGGWRISDSDWRKVWKDDD